MDDEETILLAALIPRQANCQSFLIGNYRYAAARTSMPWETELKFYIENNPR